MYVVLTIPVKDTVKSVSNIKENEITLGDHS